jgi:tetratricopeptide (TPR) repeat protein
MFSTDDKEQSMPIPCFCFTTIFLLILALLGSFRMQSQPTHPVTVKFSSDVARKSPPTVKAADSVKVNFNNLFPKHYWLDAIAPGYQARNQGGELVTGGLYQQPNVPQSSEPTANAGTGQSQLDPAARKELNKALEALRADKPANAKKHLQWASQVAPADPDVTFSWGMYYAEMKDWSNAESYWQKTLLLYPDYPFALAGLAQLALRTGDLRKATDDMERAVQASPSSWHLEERLAEAYFLEQKYDQAQSHAEHAIQLSEDRASLAQLVLAKVFLHRNEPQHALNLLYTLQAHEPSGPRAEEAQHLITGLQQAPGATVQTAADSPETASSAAFANLEELVPPMRWMPPNVDESIPAVQPGISCPLQTVLQESGKQVRAFVTDVNSISATETLEHEVIDSHGFPSKRESRTYTYVASLQQIRPGTYSIQEFRNGKTGQDIFPDHLGTFGLTSLVMIFHPAYRDEYEFSCEGLSHWQGGKAWQVHFRQRPDKPARVRGYGTDKQMLPVSLRGRAWIAADTFQIVSLETDLVAPVPQIPLNAEHIFIEYAPVQFRTYKRELWLPQSADLFIDFNVRRIHRTHRFTDYMLFSVDETQKIATPRTSEPQSAAPEPK